MALVADLRSLRFRRYPPMTLAELAAKARISQGHTSMIERGVKRPSPAVVLRLARAHRVSVQTIRRRLRNASHTEKDPRGRRPSGVQGGSST